MSKGKRKRGEPCANCDSDNTRTRRTVRRWKGFAVTYRQHKCLDCGHRFGTLQVHTKAFRRIVEAAAQRLVAARASTAVPVGDHGGNRTQDYKKKSNNLAHGTSAAYLTARIAKEAPAILERMKRYI